ncbi:MAG TPA: selenoneine synthase SenA [Gemmataceae bacterium]|nr:selenoneine synthase SenA [Gemmataceae bacterium]
MKDPGKLLEWVRDARRRTLELIADLSEEQMLGPRLDIINPLLWEIGHVAWFQEKWVLRHAGKQPPIRTDADNLYDSAGVPHDVRWNLPLSSRAETLRYMQAVEDRVLERLQMPTLSQEDIYFVLLSVFHEDMHGEAFTYLRQTLGYPAPSISGRFAKSAPGGPLPGDVFIPGSVFLLGASPQEPFVFDNEKWEHPVETQPFAIARAPVTQAEFVAFVEDGGYQIREWWSNKGWTWREQTGAHGPVYWKKDQGKWWRRDFDRWVGLEPHLPLIHVCWYEADAYCKWANRRLPTEVEWELAAAAEPQSKGIAPRKRRFPWGDSPPNSYQANLDGRALGCVDVGCFPEGESKFGCRQMIGNVWEWTASDFLPYPGFVIDPYQEYSAPWFKNHKVLRGGCWVSRGRLLRNTWRNFYKPERRDVWAGFRTCALEV